MQVKKISSSFAQPYFKHSIATWGSWLPYWTVRYRIFPLQQKVLRDSPVLDTTIIVLMLTTFHWGRTSDEGAKSYC